MYINVGVLKASAACRKNASHSHQIKAQMFFLITSYVDTSEGNRHYKFNERKFPTKCLKTFLLKVCSKVS